MSEQWLLEERKETASRRVVSSFLTNINSLLIVSAAGLFMSGLLHRAAAMLAFIDLISSFRRFNSREIKKSATLPDEGAVFPFGSTGEGVGGIRLWVETKALLDDGGFELVEAAEVSLEREVGGIWLFCEA